MGDFLDKLWRQCSSVCLSLHRASSIPSVCILFTLNISKNHKAHILNLHEMVFQII